MIEDFGRILAASWDAMGIPIHLYGFDFTLQQVLIFSMIASAILGAIGWFFWGS